MSDLGARPDATVLVVGAALAGIRACEQLRKEGFRGRLVLVGAEPHEPYDRPPLTKQYLAGKIDEDRLALRPRGGIEPLELELRLGVAARALDTVESTVVLEDGETLSYDALVVATGARPRTLPGATSGVVTLRYLDETRALRERLQRRGTRFVVIGGGFLGLEAAATAAELGARVTVVEAGGEPLERVVGTGIGGALAAYHRSRGVEVRTAATVAAVHGAERPEAVELGDGTVLECDDALVAIGVVAETHWLEGSGLRLEDGLVTDETLLAAPGIVAAGDVVRFPSARAGGLVRHEHWTSAAEQAVHAARRLLGHDVGAFDPVPYFWSDQFDLKILGLGHPSAAAHVEVVAGSLESGRFLCLFERGGRLVAAVGSNMARQLMAARPLVEAQVGFDAALAAQKETADSAGTT